MSAPQRKSPWIWVSLGCIGIVAAIGIVLVVFTVRFINSEEGQQMQRTLAKTESLKTAVPEAALALRQYVQEHGDFPETLEAVKDKISEGSYAAVSNEMTYTKPAKDAPPETIILTTGLQSFMQGSSMEIVVQKDFVYYSLTRAPLE